MLFLTETVWGHARDVAPLTRLGALFPTQTQPSTTPTSATAALVGGPGDVLGYVCARFALLCFVDLTVAAT